MFGYKNIGSLLLLLSCTPCFAGVVDTMGVKRRLAERLRGINCSAYSYVKSAVFPNGDKDKLEGKVVMDDVEKAYFDNCGAYTLFYDGTWFYRADHRKKRVTILNYRKYAGNAKKKQYDRELFENHAFHEFLDSVVLTTAALACYVVTGPTISYTFTFPTSSHIKRFALSYDTLGHHPLEYSLDLFEPAPQHCGDLSGTTVKVVCKDFVIERPLPLPHPNDYFEVKHGKMTLKKYIHYQVISKL